jgi:hypothetical protein
MIIARIALCDGDRLRPFVVRGGQLDRYVTANRFRAPTTAVMNVFPPPWPASSRT